MSIAAFIRDMLARGFTIDQALNAAESHERTFAVEKPRSGAAIRQARYRARQAEGVTNHNGNVTRDGITRDVTSITKRNEVTPPRERKNITSNLDISGKNTSEAKASSVGVATLEAPIIIPEKPPPKARGTRLSETWEPGEAGVEIGRREGLTDEEIQRAAREFRNYWCARSGKDATKLDWLRTWDNRCSELAQRKHRNGAGMAARSGLGRGGGSGVADFATIVAQRRGYGAN